MISPNVETFIGCDSSYRASSIVLYGAPYDSTTSYRPGARFGPAAIRHESYGLETFSPYQNADLTDYDIFDSGDLELCFGSSESALADIQQRAAMVLQDVHYVIECHFDLTDKAAPSDNPGKFQDIVTRRMRKGQCFSTPYFGCREFPAHFKQWEGGPIPTIDETRDLGFMLYDFDYSDPQNITPLYFRAKMEHGVIQVAGCEVFR